MIPTIQAHLDEISDLCRRFHVRRLEVFGSAAREEDFEACRSDADFLVEFEAGAEKLASFLDLKEALEELIRLPVDLLDRDAIETSRNYIRRAAILSEAQPIYAA